MWRVLTSDLWRRGAPRVCGAQVFGGVRRLSSAVEVHRSSLVPTYSRDIARYSNVIMHLGVGAFHRSHQAHYLHELLATDGSDAGWAICGVGLMPFDSKMADALKAQDHLYTVLSQASMYCDMHPVHLTRAGAQRHPIE